MLKSNFIGMTKKFSKLVIGYNVKAIYSFVTEKIGRFLFYGDEKDLNLIRLTFSIYFYKKNKDFDFIEKMLSELFVAVIISPTDYGTLDSCNDCASSGEISCDFCDGTGEVDCPECDGSGEDYDGETCGDCGGDGKINCNTCNGSGYERCQSCDGTGEFEDDMKKEYHKQIIVSFNKELKDACEINENTQVPIMTEDEFSEKMMHSINIDVDSSSGYEKIDFDYSKVYCSFFDMGLSSLTSIEKSNGVGFVIKYDDNTDSYYH